MSSYNSDNGAPKTPLFEVQGLSVSYGGVHAVKDMSLTVSAGEIAGLIGPNGAGKSSAVNAITGVVVPAAGTVTLAGSDVTGLSSRDIARRGVGRTFQQAQVWKGMSVRQNLELARSQAVGAAHPVDTLAERVGISPFMDGPAAQLPYGTRRLVEVARALALAPQLLVLDEPGAGLSEEEKQDLRRVLFQVRDEGVAILLIDHDMQLVMSTCSYLYVLDSGELISQGPPTEVRADPKVLESYLGKDVHA